MWRFLLRYGTMRCLGQSLGYNNSTVRLTWELDNKISLSVSLSHVMEQAWEYNCQKSVVQITAVKQLAQTKFWGQEIILSRLKYLGSVPLSP